VEETAKKIQAIEDIYTEFGVKMNAPEDVATLQAAIESI